MPRSLLLFSHNSIQTFKKCATVKALKLKLATPFSNKMFILKYSKAQADFTPTYSEGG